ncbi:aromatic acid exporter family protein [Streptomyces sp. NPDC059506]|uniref:FUSC family protein n=1 Tax=Streptomyces TaxID=1883 RepID=UPI0015FC02AA|nr:aromatic acid exporter family protein [Streptomyces sp. SCUT-3]QMV24478.1 hypothetical protein GQS52_24915 [Streptomyces sp. SCUT-3]
MTGPVDAGRAVRRRAGQVCRHLGRAVRRPGDERDDVLLQAKAVLAVVAAWSLASWLLPPGVTTFAPFTALLALQGTVYRSLWQSLRYMGAVVVGVVLAAGFGTTAGVHAWSLAVLMVFALAAARLQPLGAQRTQVPVTAVFAFAAGGGQLDYSLHLVAAVVIGVGCGLAVTVFWAPPTRYRSAAEAVDRLSSEVCGLLSDISRTLRETTPGEREAREWADRAARIGTTARRARETVESGEESARLNPRRVLNGGRRSLEDHHAVINTLERVGAQAQSVARGLSYAAGSDHYDALARDFLTGYADLLADTAAAARRFGRQDRDGSVPDDSEPGSAAPGGAAPGGAERDGLRESVEGGRRRYRDLAARNRRENLDAPGEWPLYGALLTDAHRILDELDRPDLVPARS